MICPNCNSDKAIIDHEYSGEKNWKTIFAHCNTCKVIFQTIINFENNF